MSSERTAIPISLAESTKRRSNTSNPIQEPTNEPALDPTASRIITTPTEPSAEDAQALDHIKSSIADDEFRERLPSLHRYFDGEATLEEIAAREGLKRSKVDAWVEQLQDEGFLLSFRHL